MALQALVPDDRRESIDRFLEMWRESRQHRHFLVEEMGPRATRAVYTIEKHGNWY